MTAQELRRRLASVPDDAELYVYTGPHGTRVQAEPMGASAVVVLSSPECVPQAGGPTR